MMSWELRTPQVATYQATEYLPGDKADDVSNFNRPTHILTLQIRRYLTIFGRRIWTGDWKNIRIET